VFFVSAEGVYQGWRNQYTSNFACDIVADKDGYCYVAIDYKLEKLDTLGNVLYSVDSAFSNPRIFMGGDNLFVSSPNATDDNTDIFYKINPATGDVILTDENYPDWPFNTDAIGADTSGNVYRAYTSDAGILTVQRLKQVALDTPATPTTQADVSGYFSALFSDNPGPFTNDFQLAVKRQLCGLGLAATQITAPVEFPKLFKPGDGAYLAKNIIVLFPDNPALSTEQVLQMLDRETFLYIPANIGKLLTVMFGTIPVEFIFNADTITINGITVSIPEGYPYSGERGVDAIYYIDIGGGLNLWYSHIGSGLFGLFSSTTPVVPCFTKNASVLVPGGYLPIDKVKRGQIVITGDGRRVAVKSVRKWVVPAGKDSYPYLLPAGKYGAKKTVEVSGDHRIYSGAPGKFRLTSGRWNQSEFKAVSELPGLRRRVTRGSVTWYNIVLPDYYRDTLVVDGVIAESLQHIGFRLMSMRDWNIVRKQISTPQASRAIISGSSVMVPYEY
jgi:hypothetical protein